MPSLSTEDIQSIERLSEEYGISFHANLDSSQWPISHRQLFQDVHDLTERRFQTYAVDIATQTNEPWKEEIKYLAEELTSNSSHCTGANEDTWRSACEPIIFARLSSEVNCRKCRGRIWQSEITAARRTSSEQSKSPNERPKALLPCRCRRGSVTISHLRGVGTQKLFGYRRNEAVIHDPDVAKRLTRKGERPDTIYGLRRTKNIKSLLNSHTGQSEETSTGSSRRKVHELLGPSNSGQPIKQTGDAPIFPFLLYEAKSGSAADDWHSIRMQSCFPIRTFLETQWRLRSLSGQQPQERPPPVVWFLYNKGEDWRLAIAFIEDGVPEFNKAGTSNCKIADVWHGSIATLDKSLQLLLLVDYICDWARRIYRETVIEQLKTLAPDHESVSDFEADGVVNEATENISTCMHSNAFVAEGNSYGVGEGTSNIAGNNVSGSSNRTWDPADIGLTKTLYGCLRASFELGHRNARKNMITSNYPATFGWLFNEYDKHEEDSESESTSEGGSVESDELSSINSAMQFGESFADWLECGQGMYLIWGKPASGKSTLVKFALAHPATNRALQKWNQGSAILDHFFWKPGNVLQHSIKGFLCSLLSQIAAVDPTTILECYQALHGTESKKEASDWDSDELQSLALHYFEKSHQSYCIFIDGLDELRDMDEIHCFMHLIDSFQARPLVKICLSSRPDLIIRTHFQRHPSVRMQDMTKHDIETFVVNSLHEATTCAMSNIDVEQLATRIIEMASGVFLWAVLVVKQLKRGISNRDSDEELSRRLDATPVDLFELYKDMWLRSNEDHSIYRRISSAYFRLTSLLHKKFLPVYMPCLMAERLPMFELAAGSDPMLTNWILTDDQPTPHKQLHEACRTTAARVEASCGGLLEVYHDPSTRPGELWHSSPACLDHELSLSVDFVHRTAYDFLVDTEEGRIIRDETAASFDEVFTTIFLGCLMRSRVLRTAVRCQTCTDDLCHEFMSSVEVFLYSLAKLREQLSYNTVESLLSRIRIVLSEDYLFVENEYTVDTAVYFLATAGRYGFSEYVQKHLTKRHGQDARDAAVFILREICAFEERDHRFLACKNFPGRYQLIKYILEMYWTPYDIISEDLGNGSFMRHKYDLGDPWLQFIIGILSYLERENVDVSIAAFMMRTIEAFLDAGFPRNGYVAIAMEYDQLDDVCHAISLENCFSGPQEDNCIVVKVSLWLLLEVVVRRLQPGCFANLESGNPPEQALIQLMLFRTSQCVPCSYFIPQEDEQSKQVVELILYWFKGDLISASKHREAMPEQTQIGSFDLSDMTMAIHETVKKCIPFASKTEDWEGVVRSSGLQLSRLPLYVRVPLSEGYVGWIRRFLVKKLLLLDRRLNRDKTEEQVQ